MKAGMSISPWEIPFSCTVGPLSEPGQVPSERLDRFLAQVTGESREKILRQIKQGAVGLNGKVCTKPSVHVLPRDEIRLQWLQKKEDPFSPQEAVGLPENLPILYEDDAVLCLNKPGGMVVHPAPTTRELTVVDFVRGYASPPLSSSLTHQGLKWHVAALERGGLVHRLDKGTSGVLLIAKTAQVQRFLSEQFQERKVQKEYLALLCGKVPQEGFTESKLGRSSWDRKKMSSRCRNGRLAQTAWKNLFFWEDDNLSLVALFPRSGRTHQLRVHMSEMGFPVLGDTTYGARRTAVVTGQWQKAPLNDLWVKMAQQGSFFLHAHRLHFLHPLTLQRHTVEAPIPEHFRLVTQGWVTSNEGVR